jgi:hypothetical protein
MNIREVQKWHEEQVAECRSEDDEQSLQFHKDCVQALADIKVPLLRHITDGGAVYLMDNHDGYKATTVIRLDGGAVLVRCSISEETK